MISCLRTQTRSSVPYGVLGDVGAHLVGRFLGDQRGAVVAMIALAAIPAFFCFALAVDLGRGYLLRSKLAEAIDLAGFEGWSELEIDLGEEEILRYFYANFQNGYMGATLSDEGPAITYNKNDKTLTIDVEATMPAHFLTLGGVDAVTVTARSVVPAFREAFEGPPDLMPAPDLEGEANSNQAN